MSINFAFKNKTRFETEHWASYVFSKLLPLLTDFYKVSVSINVLDGTSYVVEARLKVVAWVGVGISINVLDRTSYVVEITLGY